jgi:DNA uptake protein ComE-like DNA-binding protein
VKDFFKSLFGASSKEIIGFSALIIILVISIIIPRIVSKLMAEDDSHWAEDEKLLDSLVVLIEKEQNRRQVNANKAISVHNFNPNDASQAELQTLGFSEKIAQRIINYRDKGGVFRTKGDLYKIYDIDSSLVEELYDFIDLPIKVVRIEKKDKPGPEIINQPEFVNKVNPVELPDFDINMADTATLKTIKGIGSVLSKRIIDFRENLGGFIDSNQLYEVYNLDSVVVLRLVSKMYIEANFIPRKLQINQASEEELAGHPYLSWQQARLIIAYRNQHGDYNTRQELLKVYALDEKDVNRIVSYLDWTPSN